MRCQQYEQRSLAIQVLTAYGEAMRAPEQETSAPSQGGNHRRDIPPEQLFGDFGAKVKVAGGK